MFFKERLLGLRRMAVLSHDSSSCWEATVDRNFLHHFCIISSVKPHYFRSVFHSTFLRFGFHSCPRCRTVEQRSIFNAKKFKPRIIFGTKIPDLRYLFVCMYVCMLDVGCCLATKFLSLNTTHSKNRVVLLTISLSCLFQISEPI